MHQRRHRARSPWLWSLALSAISAAMVAAAGLMLSRHTEKTPERPSGNQADDLFRQLSRQIDELESLWQEALAKEADRLLDSRHETEPLVVGVIQSSRLNPAIADPVRDHFRVDDHPPELKPVLEKFARGEAGEWPFSEQEMLTGSGWIEVPGKPPAWRQGNGRAGVILLLDPVAASSIAADRLRQTFRPETTGIQTEGLSFEGPSGVVLMLGGEPPAHAKPDETLRHVSRFGDWTMRRYFPVKVVTSYQMPLLAGSFVISGLLLAGGIIIAASQGRAMRRAEEQVSFVNRVSHELRTPLTNLLLQADLALDSRLAGDPKLHGRLRLIRQETSRLSRIVDNVLAFARSDRGVTASRIDKCNVEAIILDLNDCFTPLFARKSIVCNFENRVAVEIFTDGDAFSQILSNLLSNVDKYAGESATARLTISMVGETLIAEIEDNGPGIPDEAKNRIFQPFERVGKKLDEGASGTGLGLAISRDLARQMGGSLELLPAAKGARFQLRIPVGERRIA